MNPTIPVPNPNDKRLKCRKTVSSSQRRLITMVTIDYTILGMLSWKPMTGYDMKRMMQNSPVMYW